jgi:enoyl-CoA hydratase/3-hydroxyacyl-CoA dehydrogenase
MILSAGSTSMPESGRMNAKAIKEVAVLGAGTMGHGIAQLAAQMGCSVTLQDVEDRFLDSGLEKIRWSLGKLVEKNRITREQADLVFHRIRRTTDLRLAVSESDLVVEAAPEVMELKKELFASIDRYSPQDAILASNTSSLPIGEIAKATARPQNVVGMHFFNPPQLMRLVEIILGPQTAYWVAQTATEFAKGLGKETIVCRKYVPGFVVNNVLHALGAVPMAMYVSGEATPEEIDSALINKAGFPMGVFLLRDYSGIDVGYNVQKLFESYGYPPEPGSPLEKMVKEGRLGAKVGHGFYEWKEGQRPKISVDAGKRIDITPIIASGVNAAAELIRQGVATREDIDKGIRLGLGFPKGILETGDEIGLDELVESLTLFDERHGRKNRELSPLLVGLVHEGKLGKKKGKGFYNYH